MKVLSLNYLGNIQYFSKVCGGDCVIDTHEHYQKQSYRNRCDIMTANGVAPLVIQTVKGRNFDKNSMAETRIDYSKRWQHQHWQAIVSAYRNSPYFDFYAEAFEPFYTRRYDLLVDFNKELLETVMKLLGSTVELQFSDCYVESATGIEDWRNGISPKERLRVDDPEFKSIEYWQVFGDKHPFADNLSVIDLLFCEGTNALQIIKESRVERI